MSRKMHIIIIKKDINIPHKVVITSGINLHAYLLTLNYGGCANIFLTQKRRSVLNLVGIIIKKKKK